MMSSFTTLGVDLARELKDACLAGWDAHKRYQHSLREADDAYKRRLNALEEQRRRADEDAEHAYEETMRALKERFQAARRHVDAASVSRKRLQTVQETCGRIMNDCMEIASSWLADICSLQTEPEYYADIITAKNAIREKARSAQIQAGMLPDTEEEVAELERTARELKAQLGALFSLLRSKKSADAKLAGQERKFMALVSRLMDEAEPLAGFASHIDDSGAAARVLETVYAMEVVRRFVYGADAFYLGREEVRDLEHLYGVAGMGEKDGLRAIADSDMEQIARRNLQYRAAKRHGIENRVRANREALSVLHETYLDMYRTVHDSLEGAVEIEATEDIDELVQLLRDQIESLRKQYSRRLRHEAVQATLERALAGSKRGMRVRRIAGEQTKSGNSKALYQIGADGTAIEVYVDAAGQILIEAGGITEEPDNVPTDRQAERILGNTQYFCDHTLPAILEAFGEELADEDGSFSVRRQKQPDEDTIHLFSLRDYSSLEASPIVVARDGSLHELGRVAYVQREKADLIDLQNGSGI